MELPVELFELRSLNVGIDLGGHDVFMTEEVLDDSQVRSSTQQVGGEGMAELMRRRVTSQTLESGSGDGACDGARGERFVAAADQERVRRWANVGVGFESSDTAGGGWVPCAACCLCP